ncbi:hypothetical protein [Lactococcus cremoris]|uniref:hypothetical protein n=1 Tax=Lactococcus lactis subsp. cremoris TaxID=1359 RepID=UPI000BDF4BCC|nr:hypothetical protein [Lactococcus cremoris]
MFRRHVKILCVLIMILPIFFVVSHVKSEEKSSKNYSFEVTVTNQGIPLKEHSIEYENIQNAYENLRKGIIPNNLKESSLWNSLVSEQQPYIDLGNDLQLGEGIIHTRSEAEQIIKVLFETNFDVLQYLNNSEEQYNSNSINNMSKLVSPENKAILETNHQGIGRGQGPKGLTAIIESGNIVSFVNVSKNKTSFSVDISQATNAINLEFLGIKKSTGVKSKLYVVENKQEVKYKITVSKDILMNSGNELRILTPPNISLSLEASSVPLSVNSILPEVIPADYYSNLELTYGNFKASQEKLVEEVGENLKYNWSNVYSFSLPESEESIEITGTLSINPQVETNNNFLLSDASSFNLPIQLYSFNQKGESYTKKPSTFKVSAQIINNNSHNLFSINSPELTTAGINFITADSEKKEIVQGSQYVLGKKVQNKYYIYSPSGWSEVAEKDLFNINPTDYMVMSGGFLYNFGSPNGIPLSIDSKNWNKNFKKITQINQSIIEIRGLAMGEQYFMMQVSSPKGYPKNNNLDYFKAYNNGKKIASLTSNSIGFAKKQLYELNGSIPGYKAGEMEYNLLSVSEKSEKEMNIMNVIIFPVLLLILGIILVVALLLIVF